MSSLLKVALSQWGTREFPGDDNNPEVVKYFEVLGYGWSDSVPWCSAFMNWCALKSDHEHTGKLTARSWLSVGTEVVDPMVGDVVVFSRGDKSSWKGHVGLYVKQDSIYIWSLGGNQDNMVNIKTYDKDRLLGYRRLRIVEG